MPRTRIDSDVITLRHLPPNEWYRLAVAFEEARLDMPLPKPEQGIIIAAEDNGRLVGCVGAEKSWNVNPIWIAHDYRGNRLAESMAHQIKTFNAEGLAEFLVTTNPHVEVLVHRLGFVPLEGQLWRRL